MTRDQMQETNGELAKQAERVAEAESLRALASDALKQQVSALEKESKELKRQLEAARAELDQRKQTQAALENTIRVLAKVL